MNMYPWYRDSVGGQLGQLCGPMTTTIKTENGYNDCMLALDYATQSKFMVKWPIDIKLSTVVIHWANVERPQLTDTPTYAAARGYVKGRNCKTKHSEYITVDHQVIQMTFAMAIVGPSQRRHALPGYGLAN
ncbi:hypothetical protein GWI33_016768 [Rhynchophorus ferrugineus]|uniref:Uncharacterized protein n=1 Tax=Rhynchophorus ferrugineus TaxID=354439 RepID=A0A834HXC8_RHYFE|nr:hypothetical protein GWI33_016768 [Rhynchophorus ferrugineus]